MLEHNEPLLQGLIEKYLLSNTHRVTVELVPDPAVGEAREAAERQFLLESASKLGSAGVAQAIQEAERLAEIQHTPDPPEVLAMVRASERAASSTI